MRAIFILGHLGGMLGPCWAILGACWGYVGVMLGHGGPCWAILGHVEGMLSYVEVMLDVGRCWGMAAMWKLCWMGQLQPRMRPKHVFFHFRAKMADVEAWRATWAMLRLSWAKLGPCRAILGPSWHLLNPLALAACFLPNAACSCSLPFACLDALAQTCC